MHAKDGNFSGGEGNAVILHIGEISARLSPYEKTEKQLIIPPGRFMFFMTKEMINMPLNCDGTLFMSPSTSNKGVHFFTLGHVDPGFRMHSCSAHAPAYLFFNRLLTTIRVKTNLLKNLSYSLKPVFAD